MKIPLRARSSRGGAEAPATLLEAVLAVQKAIPGLDLAKTKEGQVQSRKYKYLTLDRLHDQLMPLLTANGLVWITLPGDGELAYRLIHVATGESIEGQMPLILGDEITSQRLGSAITYNRRYALTAVTGAVADEDDDASAASQSPTRRSAADHPPKTISRTQRVAMVAEIEDAGLDLATTMQLANIDNLQKVDVTQAKRVRKMIDEVKAAKEVAGR